MIGKRGLKGQVTIFVIVGIVILALVFSGVYLKSYLDERALQIEAKKTETLPQSVKPVKLAIDSCIKETVEEAVKIAGFQGGYITLPEDKYILNNYNDFSNKLQILPGLNVPYWYYESASGVQNSAFPSLNTIQSEIKNYVDASLEQCVEQAKTLARYGYELKLGTPSSKVVIAKNQDLKVTINYPITFTIKDEVYTFSNFDQTADIDFYSIYDAAKQIYDDEANNNFLEQQTLDMMVIYDEIPYDSLEFNCVPKIWPVEKVESDLKDIINTNIPLYHIKGTSYSLTRDSPSIFEWSALSKDYPYLNVNLMHSKKWPFYMTVNPKTNGVLKGEPISNLLSSQELSIPFGVACMTQYHFVYDLKYPVLISLNDPNAFGGEGYTLQFATQVILKNNQPKVNTAIKEAEAEEFPISCENANIKHKIYALAPNINDELIPLEDADISYKCISTTCSAGKTSKEDNDKYLNTKLLPCINGLLTASKEGFNEGSISYSSNEPSTAYITLEPYYYKDVEVKVIDPQKGIRDPYESEEIIFSFDTDGYSTSFVYPSDVQLRLVAGTYNVQSIVIRSTDNPITIPFETRQVCSKVPQTGIGGLFGLTSEKCEIVDAEDVSLDQVVAGGANFEWEVSRFNLAEDNKLTLYTYYNGIPTTLDGLTTIQQKIESNSQEPGFKEPKFTI